MEDGRAKDAEPAPSDEQLAAWEERAETTRARLAVVKAEVAKLLAELAGLRADGEDESPAAEKLREERRALVEERQELQSTLPILEERLRDGRAAALRARAAARIRDIQGSVGGLSSTYRDDAGRVASAASALVEAVERMNGRYARIVRLRVEARALARRFGLEAPDMPVPLAPQHQQVAADGLRRVDGVGLSKTLEHVAEREGVPADAPGAAILAEAGPTEEERAAAERAARKTQEREAEGAALMRSIAGEVERAEALRWAGGFRG